MGARGRGHIALLCDVARPTVGVVTAVAAAHAELFGTVEEVAAAKGELVEALPAAGTAVLNADDERVAAMAAPHAGPGAALLGRAGGAAPTSSPTDVALDDELRPRFRCARRRDAVDGRPRGSAACTRSANALAAAGAALACGVRARRRRRRARRGRAVAVADGPAPRAGGRVGPERRLQRQPDVDGGGAAVAGRAPGRAAASPCSG